MVQLGDTFNTMAEAKKAITQWLLDTGKSYKVYRAERTRYNVSVHRMIHDTE